MKNVQIVITNQAVSLAMIGTPPPKPAPRNAQVLINILVPVQTKPAEAARLATDYMRLVLAPADMLGTEVLVPSKTLVWKAHSLAIFLIVI